MGNKIGVNSPNSPPTLSRKPSFLDFKNLSKKKTIQKDNFLKICEPSIYYGQCIQVEPDENAYEVKCIFCKSLNFDDGLETPTRCLHCNNLYIAKDNGILKLQENCNLSEYLTQTIAAKQIYTKKPKELNHLILYCNSNTLPVELIIENKIDYNTIIQKIILPFFSIKSRVIRFGIIFKIGNFEFKAVSCEPRNGGRITKNTRIHCYKEYSSSQNLQFVKIGMKSGKKGHINEDDIIKNIARMRSSVHLSLDQNILLNNNLDLNIIFASPCNGNLTKDTKIELHYGQLKEIKSMSIACNQNTVSKIIRNPCITTSQEIEEVLRQNYILPYFQGISRFVEKGKPFSLEDHNDFLVRDCNPSFGLVSSKTKILILLLENMIDIPKTNIQNIQRENTPNTSTTNTHKLQKSPLLTSQLLPRNPSSFSEEDEEEAENYINENENENEVENEEDEEFHEEEEEKEEEKINTMPIRTHQTAQTRSPPNDHSPYLNFPPQLRSSQMNLLNYRNNERHLEFLDNMNDESDSSGNNASNSNLNSDNSIPMENPPNQQNQPNNNNNQEDNSFTHQIERERLERERFRFRYLRPPHLRVFHENPLNNEEINNAIHRVLNAFLLFNDPFMQSMLANRRDSNSVGNSNVGATKFQINRLPEHKISKEFIQEKRIIEENLTKCMICLNEYEDQESVRTMPCMHYFHKNCLDIWLVKCKTCPICKTACDVNEKDILNIE